MPKPWGVAVVDVKMHVGGEEEVAVTCDNSKADFWLGLIWSWGAPSPILPISGLIQRKVESVNVCFGLLVTRCTIWFCHTPLLIQWLNQTLLSLLCSNTSQTCVVSLCIQSLDPLYLDRVGMEIWTQVELRSINNCLLLETFLLYHLINIIFSDAKRRSVSLLFSRARWCRAFGIDHSL